jgi:hypothetical protein
VRKLTWPQVNAWRLARHRLSLRLETKRRFERVAADACGIHAQMMSAADLQLAARVDGLTARDVQAALWKRRTLVRTWAMRGTLHLFWAEDFPLIVGALRNREHFRNPSWLRAYGLTLPELETALAAMREALDGRSLTREELTEEVAARAGKAGDRLRKILASGWGDLLKPAAYQGIICSGPSRGRNVTFARPDQWIEGWRDLDPTDALQEALRRFVHLHGPTRPENFAHWWGLAASSTRRAWRAIEDELDEVQVEGEKAWMLGSDAEELAPMEPDRSVRLLPNFDAYVLAYHPRSRMVADKDRDHVFRQSGWISPVVLVGGVIAGLWELERTKDRAVIRVEPFGRLPSGGRQEIREEAERIGRFLGMEAEARFEPVTFLKREGTVAKAAVRRRQTASATR